MCSIGCSVKTSRAYSGLLWCSSGAAVERDPKGSFRWTGQSNMKDRDRAKEGKRWERRQQDREQVMFLWLRFEDEKRKTSSKRGRARPRKHESRDVEGPAVSVSAACVSVCVHTQCSLGLCNFVLHRGFGAGRSCVVWLVWQHAQSSTPSFIHYTAHAAHMHLKFMTFNGPKLYSTAVCRDLQRKAQVSQYADLVMRY